MEAATPNSCVLPIECVELILDELCDLIYANRLFPLLTVSKFFFRIAAKRLYRNPIDALNTCQCPDGVGLKLLALILHASPSLHTDLQDLRYELAKRGMMQFREQPYCDYLSFIQSISVPHHDSLLVSICNSREQRPYKARRFAALVWAACGHRLSSVQDLIIPCRDIGRYILHIDQMRGMRSIQLYIHDVPCRSEENSTFSETGSSGVYKDTFSMDIDLAYEFLRRWNAATTNATASIPYGSNCQRRGASTVITLINQDRLSFSLFSDQHYSAELRRAMCILPKSFLPMILLDDEPSWYRFAWFPETIDLSHVLEIDGVGPIDSVMNPSAAVATPRPWPSQGKAAVIQQCRSLEYLTLSLEPGDQDVFDWKPSWKRPFEATGFSVPSIKGLHIWLLANQVSTKPCRDALTTFRHTLQSLTITDIFGHHHVDLSLFHSLPSLTKLSLQCGSFEDRHPSQPFSGCPNLTDLTLATLRTSIGRLHAWNLPSLIYLTLYGHIASDFNQASLSTMCRVRKLTLSHRYIRPEEGVPAPFAWDANHWSPSHLSQLTIQGSLARNFPWSLLKQCHSLESLSLNGFDSTSSVEATKPVLTIDADFTLGSMKKLKLVYWEIEKRYLCEVLPRMFPNITHFVLQPCTPLTPYYRRRIKSLFPSAIVEYYKFDLQLP